MNRAILNGASAVAQLCRQLADHLGSDPDWAPALSRLHAGDSGMHLAVLSEPFYSLLRGGTKTVESRFSRVKCAPYGVLATGDIVLIKKSARPLTVAFQAGRVRSYQQLTPSRVTELRGLFAARIGTRMVRRGEPDGRPGFSSVVPHGRLFCLPNRLIL